MNGVLGMLQLLRQTALDNEQRMVRRDASLAWLDAYETEQGLKLAQHLVDEAALQVQSLEKDYGSGKAPQADWLAAKVTVACRHDLNAVSVT